MGINTIDTATQTTTEAKPAQTQQGDVPFFARNLRSALVVKTNVKAGAEPYKVGKESQE